MKHSERYRRAENFAREKHEGQYRRGGLPYITHPIAVSALLFDGGYDEDFLIAGLFHDLLEDTDATEAEILDLGGERVLDAVKRVTKTEGYVMADYVRGIKDSPVARAVKAADRLHNLRCAVVCSEDFKRRYILETIDWYLDLDPRIIDAVRDLAETMENPIRDLPLEYNPTDYDKDSHID